MTATLLTVDELSNEAFQAYYDCLRSIYGVWYADLILGAPREVEIPRLDEEKLHHSFCNQICAVCDGGIPEDHKEDCTFEHLDQEAHIFFLCGSCQ